MLSPKFGQLTVISFGFFASLRPKIVPNFNDAQVDELPMDCEEQGFSIDDMNSGSPGLIVLGFFSLMANLRCTKFVYWCTYFTPTKNLLYFRARGFN